MQNLIYAFRFIKAGFIAAFKRVQLQEQWVYLAVGSLVLLIIWFLPFALVVGLIDSSPISMVLIGLVGTLALFSFYAWGEITRLLASRLVVRFLEDQPGHVEDDTETKDDSQSENATHPEDDVQPEEETQNEKEMHPESETPHEDETKNRHPLERWLDVLVLVLVLPGKKFANALNHFLHPDSEDKQPWLEAHYLVLPLIAIEDLNINEAVARLTDIISQHLLRFQFGYIRVDLVAKIVHWFLCVIGVLSGLSVGIIVTDPLTTDPWRRILGLAIGLLVAWLFITLGILFSTFARSFYHSTLYQWLRNVEQARKTGDPTEAVPPAILQEVLINTA